MVAELIQPWLNACLAGGWKSIQYRCQFLQFVGDPADGFQHGRVAGVEIHPVDDALMMEDAVAEFAQESEAAVQGSDVALGFGR